MSEVPKQFNVKGGKNYKKNKSGRVREVKERKKIDIENEEGYYGTITKMCGCDNVTVRAKLDNELYRVQIPGRMYNRGGAKNRLKVGDEVVILGKRDATTIGVIDRKVTASDIDYGTATRNINDINNIFAEDEIESDDIYSTLTKNTNRTKKDNKKCGEKKYSTEEEIMADIANITINEDSDSTEESKSV